MGSALAIGKRLKGQEHVAWAVPLVGSWMPKVIEAIYGCFHKLGSLSWVTSQ